MLVPSWQDPAQIQLAKAASQLEACNRALEPHGLSLTLTDIQTLAAGRADALATSERIEFGEGVVTQMVTAFAASPFVSQTSFVATVLDLQELFYEFKNESLDRIPDEDLIVKMRQLFDGAAQGDLGYLEEALFEGLGRRVREEVVGGSDEASARGWDDEADPDTGKAAMNALTLAAHRFDVANWVDATYEPGWEGSSWLDE